MKVGVLAVQGAFAAHTKRLSAVGADATLVRVPDDLDDVDALVMPGGESTTMTKLLTSTGLFSSIDAAIREGLPVFGTCAGLILLATRVDGDPGAVTTLGALDVVVARNAYGRQIDSFESDVALSGDDRPFPAVFIRAPAIVAAEPSVEVLATLDGRPVLVRQGSVMAAAFHPELTADTRLHEMFLHLVEGKHRSGTAVDV